MKTKYPYIGVYYYDKILIYVLFVSNNKGLVIEHEYCKKFDYDTVIQSWSEIAFDKL